ncbi:hypothetical protein FA95DRAFT_1562371 [Auriscalpium vulgare]|uniref:Uncharacterized protein n=1 Tax=Auriscalpium vulgare TaxID=40419 RepID=A0ACB8RKZ1_9AGAM|nr:hypothetical protein FA95DRAFT_1562371 [Auriscalpium vulgare]
MSRFCSHWLVAFMISAWLAIAGALAIGLLLRPGPIGKIPVDDPFYGNRTLSLGMDLVNVDPVANVLVLEWTVDDDTCFHDKQGNAHALLSCPLVNIFFDPNLLMPPDGSEQPSDVSDVASSGVPTQPLFQYNVSTLLFEVMNEPFFRTQVIMYKPTRDSELSGIQGTSVDKYPFDNYQAEVFMFASEVGTNASVGLSVDSASGTAFGFQVYGDLYDDDDDNSNHINFGYANIFLTVKRGVLVKAYVIIIVIAMWLIDLVLMAIAIKAVVYGYKIEASVLLVPVATLFAFSSLRASMPGAPTSFGAVIDFVGTLPTLAYLLVTTVMCLMSFLMRHEDQSPNANGKSPSQLEEFTSPTPR